ncbi:hypothetical protein [Nocardioides panaciterrulae]|uniref:DUF3558 domain-containing protein n=1 Tax=Nocardioides panaciterrulae TaxID=661492 RepID=A0A7Y9E817_9ACTN|nr:hypothetical protein [Nocardioides panaciterrulae]NYD42692.1 hypothetical protein [Nocardioides panaciterrulae]
MDAFLTRADLKPGQPCANAAQVAVDEAAASSDKPDWLPLSEGRPTDAWTCGQAPYFGFGQGAQAVFVTLESGWAGFDPSTGFDDLLGPGGSIQELHGNPMLIQPAVSSEYSNEVIVVHDDEAVKLLSASGVSIDKLVGIAHAFAIPGKN